jgi:hypothetical protein
MLRAATLVGRLLRLQASFSNFFELAVKAMAERTLRTQLVEQRLGLVDNIHAHISFEQLPPASRNLCLGKHGFT